MFTGLPSFQGSRGESSRGPAPEGHPHPLTHDPGVTPTCFPRHTSSPFSCDDTGPARITQGNLPQLKPLNVITPALPDKTAQLQVLGIKTQHLGGGGILPTTAAKQKQLGRTDSRDLSAILSASAAKWHLLLGW